MQNHNTTAIDVNNSSVIASLLPDAARIAFTPETLRAFANTIARHIDDLNGESMKFEISHNGLTAEIEYSASFGYDGGDYYTAPCTWVENEIVRVTSVYENDGEGREFPQIAEYLETMLN